MALLSLFCPSEFLLPDYLSHMQEEEGLGHFEMSEQTFEASSSSSSVQTPVISQVSSTMNYDNHTSAPPSQTPNPRSGNGGEAEQGDDPKSTAAVTSLQDPEVDEGEKERGGRKKKRLVSITIEWKRSIRVNMYNNSQCSVAHSILLLSTVYYTLRKKRYKSCHWGGSFEKGTPFYLIYP